MENLPIEKGFAIVRWWTSQKPTDKLLVFLLSVIIAVSTVSIRLYSYNTELQKENLSGRIEAEQRNSNSLQAQRNRDDSLRAEDNKECEFEKQQIYDRVNIIKKRNENITKAIK